MSSVKDSFENELFGAALRLARLCNALRIGHRPHLMSSRTVQTVSSLSLPETLPES